MLTIENHSYRFCDGLTRREWLRMGGLGLLAAASGRATPVNASATLDRAYGRAKSCIILFLAGGPPQHETWDPKPDAPAEIRGEFSPIASKVPGLQVCELMPGIARMADQCCVLRGVTTGDSAHSSSGYYMLTGYPHTPTNAEGLGLGAPNDWPSFGAVYRRLRPGRNLVPSAVTLPERLINNPNIPWAGQDGGFLGRSADPWLLTCDPSQPHFQIPELALPGDLPPIRFDERRSLLEQVNRHTQRIDASGAIPRYDAQARQVIDLLRSTGIRKAFDLDQEPAAMRDRYGRTKLGQSVLLARRLVEAGMPLIHINWPREPGDTSSGNPLWDTHSKNAERLRRVLMPQLDAAYATLLDDLGQRGLLDETLIVLMGEFGRTPRINGGAGRDHWGGVCSVALAGGGIRGGQVIGASDRIGAYPRDGRVLPGDLTATLFHALGISAHAEFHDAFGRPLPVSRGAVITQAF